MDTGSPGLLANEAYLNIHTTAFPSGEIRGFLHEQAATVPLGHSTWPMMVLGFRVGFMAYRRRSKPTLMAV